MARLDEVAARGAQAVAELREGAGAVDRLLRHDGPELLDLDETPERVKQQIVEDADRIARMLQLHRLWAFRVGRLIVEARRTRHGKPVRVLDVGAGAGGLLFRLEDWARRRRISVELHGVDAFAGHVESARRQAFEEGRHIQLSVGDARDLSQLADDSVDVAVSTFTLHHLSPGDATRALAEIDRVAAVNFFVFDLRRSVIALPPLIALLRAGGFDAPSRHDSVVSLRRGYSVAEVDRMLRAAEVSGFLVQALPPAFLTVTRA